MSYKFVAKNQETGKTGSVTVKAQSEQSARQKLTLGGYDVVSLVRVTSRQESPARIQLTGQTVVTTTPAPEKTGFVSRLQALITRFDHFFYHGA